MFKKIKTILFVFIFFLSGFTFIKHAQAEIALPITPPLPERIEDFNIESIISSDGKVAVVERIEYNFGNLKKHGIFRFIPVVYKDRYGAKFSVRLKVKSVLDENGAPYTYTIKPEDENIQIKIGDKDRLITGKKTYVITYELERTISYFNDHDEWYWNVTGNKWSVPIKRAEISILLPKTISNTELHHKCYFGYFGSTEENCGISTSSNGKTSQLYFTSSGSLLPGQGMTIVVGVPKGIIAEPTVSRKVEWFVLDNWPLAVPIVALVVMATLWYTRGRDPKGKGVVIAQYEPPRGLSPIEIGTLINERVDKRDISSVIIDLAVRGFLKIYYLDKTWKDDYEFSKLKDEKSLTRSFEKKILEGIFGTQKSKKLSELKYKFAETTKTIKKEVYASLTKQKFFVKNPNIVRTIYVIVGFIVGLVGGIFLSGTQAETSFWNLLAFLTAGGIVVLGGLIMPKKTLLGVMVKEEIEGFKLFLSVTEKERLKFHNAPAKKPELFEKFLPYAMVLKVEKEWAKQFEGIYTKPPSWYQGNWNTFSVGYLASSLNSFSSSAASTIATTPGSSSGFSGGSSGGGFGGGGGGSW